MTEAAGEFAYRLASSDDNAIPSIFRSPRVLQVGDELQLRLDDATPVRVLVTTVLGLHATVSPIRTSDDGGEQTT